MVLALRRPGQRRQSFAFSFCSFSSIFFSTSGCGDDVFEANTSVQDNAMRFWIGVLIGLVIGVSATAAYYEFWDYGDEEITSQVDDP
jgi:hypothetical protein